MDRRIEKTKSSIVNAFLELRAHKPLEKISVKELCEKADINKSTFYTHYQDIYDLSEQLERQVAADVLEKIDNPERAFTQPDVYTRELYYAYLSHSHLTSILFSGNREGLLIVRIEESLKEGLYRLRPDLKDNAMIDTMLTLEIYGQYYAFEKCRHFGDETVINILCAHWQQSIGYLQAHGYC